MKNAREKHLLVFGTSIAWGAWDPEGGGWVDRLKRRLMARAAKEEGPEVYVYNLGISGDTTTDLLKRLNIEAEARARPGHETIVMFSIGTNDAKHRDDHDPETPPEEFRENIRELITRARTFSKTVICTGLTPVDEQNSSPAPWNARAFYRNSYQRAYESLIRSVCEEQHSLFADFSECLPEADAPTFLDNEDGLHPNADGHERMAAFIERFLIEQKVV